MNSINYITAWGRRHLLTVPAFGHLVMIACAVASYENIHSFFIKLHGSELVAIGLGVAVGAALVMAAGLLSGMVWEWRNPRLQLIAGVTTLLALLSGGLQGASYATHGLFWLWAGLLGLALPVVGELGIALAVSAYEQEQKAKRAALADEEIEARINAAVDSAMADIDMTSAKKDVEAAARKIVKNKMDALLARRIGGRTVAENSQIATHRSTESHHSASFGPHNLQMANDAKAQQVADRRIAILQLCKMNGPQGIAELRNALRNDFGIEVSDSTVRSDCNGMVNEGELVKAGRGRWDVFHDLIEELPVLEMPVLNGVH